MTDFTDEDVAIGAAADRAAWRDLDEGIDLFGKSAHEYTARTILAAVLPAYTARVRAEALREAADDWGHMSRGNNTPEGEWWLRARADAEEGDPVCATHVEVEGSNDDLDTGAQATTSRSVTGDGSRPDVPRVWATERDENRDGDDGQRDVLPLDRDREVPTRADAEEGK